MPYFYDPNLDPQKQQQNGGSGATQVTISGASPTTDNNGSTGNSGNSKGSNTGSGYQNLDKYLQTNQSQQFGNQVLGKVSDQVDKAGTQMQQAGDEFKNQVSSANILPSQDQVNQAISDPSKANKQDFQNWMKQTYQGPNNLAESQNTWNKYWSGVSQAQTNAKQLGTEGGRFSLLDQYFGKPQYNFGEKSLDNLLVQQSGIGDQTKDLQNQATMLKTKGNQEAQDLQGYAGQMAGQVEQNRNNVLNSIGVNADGTVRTDGSGAIGSQYKAVQDALAQQNAARHNQQDAFKSALSSDSISAQDLQNLGLGNLAGTNLYDLDLNKYATYGGDLNKEQTMTPEQRSRIQALSDLAGINDTFASGAPQDQSKAYNFDVNALKTDSGSRQAAYQNDLQNSLVQVPVAWTDGGKGAPWSMSRIRNEIQSTQDQLSRGQQVNGGQQFLDQMRPILAKAEADLAAKYKTGRTLK